LGAFLDQGALFKMDHEVPRMPRCTVGRTGLYLQLTQKPNGVRGTRLFLSSDSCVTIETRRLW